MAPRTRCDWAVEGCNQGVDRKERMSRLLLWLVHLDRKNHKERALAWSKTLPNMPIWVIRKENKVEATGDRVIFAFLPPCGKKRCEWLVQNVRNNLVLT